ncbi:MAG: histidinol-phosphate transaminase [Tepidanaerobacteraceae bacterium]|nr:histidinol-phosphate transaminase [Tepidanaerobacteraceae bacterium]
MRFARDDVLKMIPYMPSQEACKIKLDANESPYDVPLKVKERIWKRLQEEHFNYYYDPSCDELRESLSKYTGAKPQQIFVGSGADEIILDLILAFAGPGRDVIIPSPTFSSYEIFATVAGSNVIKVPIHRIKQGNGWIWDLDINQIKEHFTQDKDQLLFICYPNNPTGDYFDEEKVLDLINSFNGIVAVDEAYFEFGGKTFADRLHQFPHVVVIRTFSKIFSLAGLRVGYAIGHEDLINQLYKVKLPYNVSLFSQIAAVEILKETDWLEDMKRQFAKARDELKEELDNIKGLRVYPSAANFFLCELEKSRDFVYEELLKRGILTRRLSDDILKNTLRFCIGTPEQNRFLISSLREILD